MLGFKVVKSVVSDRWDLNLGLCASPTMLGVLAVTGRALSLEGCVALDGPCCLSLPPCPLLLK